MVTTGTGSLIERAADLSRRADILERGAGELARLADEARAAGQTVEGDAYQASSRGARVAALQQRCQAFAMLVAAGRAA